MVERSADDRGVRKQRVDVERMKGRIGDQRVALPVGHLGRLGEEMNAVRFAERRIGHVEAAEDAGDQESCDALSVGWTLPDPMTAIVGADRRDVIGARGCKIVKLHQPAERPQRCDDLFGDGALVERAASLARDPTQRRAECWMVEFAANIGRNAAGQIDRNAGLVFRNSLAIPRPVQRGAGRDDKTVLGRADRRRQNLVQPFRAIIGCQPAPGVDRAGNGDGMGRIVRNRQHSLFSKPAEFGLRRCPA